MSPHPDQHVLLSAFFFFLLLYSHPRGCKVVFHCGFDLMANLESFEHCGATVGFKRVCLAKIRLRGGKGRVQGTGPAGSHCSNSGGRWWWTRVMAVK